MTLKRLSVGCRRPRNCAVGSRKALLFMAMTDAPGHLNFQDITAPAFGPPRLFLIQISSVQSDS